MYQRLRATDGLWAPKGPGLIILLITTAKEISSDENQKEKKKRHIIHVHIRKKNRKRAPKSVFGELIGALVLKRGRIMTGIRKDA